jgi:dienelactone hydrolase
MKRFLLVMALGAMPAAAALQSRTVLYKEGGKTLEGYYVYDDVVSGPRPGIVMVHEWMGLNDHVKNNANQLASIGYAVFGVDIYGKGVRPTNPDAARKEAGKYKNDRALMRKRAQAGLQELLKQKEVDSSRVAAMGYCFGGTTALELARSGADLDGVISVHGGLATPTPGDAKNIKGKVLVLHGADDPGVPPTEVEAFAKEMRDAKVDWQLIAYGGAVHAFTNPKAGDDPSKGAAYNERATRRSFEHLKLFLQELFGMTQ